MPDYSEIHTYVMGEIHHEMVFLNASILRMRLSMAILRTLQLVPDNMHWLWLVDWCHIDIVNAQTRIRLWWRRLSCLWKANQLVKF